MPTKTKKLVDSNILVYAYDANSVFHQRAVTFLTNPGFDYYLTTKNITEYFAVLSKMNEPFPKVWQFYQSALANCTLLYPTPSSHAIFETLLQSTSPKETESMTSKSPPSPSPTKSRISAPTM